MKEISMADTSIKDIRAAISEYRNSIDPKLSGATPDNRMMAMLKALDTIADYLAARHVD
jgi:hypothetical protein